MPAIGAEMVETAEGMAAAVTDLFRRVAFFHRAVEFLGDALGELDGHRALAHARPAFKAGA